MTETELNQIAADWLSCAGQDTKQEVLADMERQGETVADLVPWMISACCLDESEERVLEAIRWAFDSWSSEPEIS